MPEFKLVSPFQPTGDQPAAIEKLVGGLNAGMKYQTLLGATGTGKSLGHGDLTFVVEKRGNHSRARVVPIGLLIDELFAQKKGEVTLSGDTQILHAPTETVEYFAQAIDPQSCAVALYPIHSFLRHAAPRAMYHLETACGRTATLTGDHNLWVLREGYLQLIRTDDARPTDFIPLPEHISARDTLNTIDTLKYLSASRLYVDSSDAILSFIEKHGRAPVIRTLVEHGIVAPYGKLAAMRNKTKGRGIAIPTFQTLLERTSALDGFWDPAQATVGGKLAADRLSAQLILTPAFLGLLGYYIAEGNHQHGYIVLANRDKTVRQAIEEAFAELGIPIHARASSDYQISSTAVSELFQELCGTIAHDKHLPAFWMELSDADLAHLLRAYFDGDGTVGRASDVSATTASACLANELAYALLRFGIWARLSRRWKRATNSKHKGAWYHYITISGQADLHKFQKAIGFTIASKRDALAAQLQRTEHSNVDVVPIRGSELKWLRTQLGLSQTEFARRCRLSRGAIGFFEQQKRSPRRQTLRRLVDALVTAATEKGAASATWWQRCETLGSLCQVRWTPIRAVKRVPYKHAFVYDLCVPGPETFLAGNGGMFLHNTFVMAQVIEQVQRPALVIAHNKTLAAQLYSEFREFFPQNAVEYFVSYYDYYQPEAYVPSKDLYIEKDSSINDEIDRLRLAATSSLFSRRDVIIVASVSCIYGLGSPEDYGRVVISLKRGETRQRDKVLRHLVEIYYARNDLELGRGKFRVRGDTLEVAPAYGETAYRIEFFGDEIDRITEIDPLTGELLLEHTAIDIYPAKHFITPQEKLAKALEDIEAELNEQLKLFREQGKLLEAQRIEQRTKYDLEMMRELGFTSGIENYSRHLSQRAAGSPPWTLLDYFPDDYLIIIDESHNTIPQVRGMYNGDQARKGTLVDFGFRLPSALDNRPLKFDEFESKIKQLLFVSATPAPFERGISEQIVEQIIRPTGLIDPTIIVRPIKGQVDDLVAEIRKRIGEGERVLVTTLTKRMAEDLADYLHELAFKVHYLHSEIQTLERIEILRDLRMGVYDVIVGINLLREGLDLPEVSLVAILDADKEGFLRSETSLIQTTGRAARHVNGTVIMYADKITDSMQRAIDETNRRRAIQDAHNKAHGIEPQGIVKEIKDLTDRVRATAESRAEYKTDGGALPLDMPKSEAQKLLSDLEKQMKDAAGKWEFEKAAMLRDQIMELRAVMDASDARPEWQKVMADEDHWEIQQLRDRKAAMTPNLIAPPRPVRARMPSQRRR